MPPVSDQNRAGIFDGEQHSENGIPITLIDSKTHIEVEGGEFNFPEWVQTDKTIHTLTGTNYEVIKQLFKIIGADWSDKVTDVKSGDIIICIRSAFDNEVRTYTGTITQILSAINESCGCKHVESGATMTNHETGETVKMKEGGLVAPNGKPSNLTPEQYKLVRTPKFKKWFGDWENDKANSSKVIDENGEPKVVYHGSDTKKRFNVFKTDEQNLRNVTSPRHANIEWWEFGTFFTDDKETANRYVDIKNGSVRAFFLDIKNPIENGYDWEKRNWADVIPYIFTGGYEKKANDGFILKGIVEADNPQTTYNVKRPEQIKLADGTNKTFDPKNPDIRKQFGGHLTVNPTPEQRWQMADWLIKNPELIALKNGGQIAQGYIIAPYSKLKGIFGEPNVKTEKDKIGWYMAIDKNHTGAIWTEADKSVKQIQKEKFHKWFVWGANDESQRRLYEATRSQVRDIDPVKQKEKDKAIRLQRWIKKREHIHSLSNNIHNLRAKLSRDLDSDDEKTFLVALIISIMDKTGERVGNPKSAGNGHFGVTCFTRDHIKVIGSKILLDYVGKTGVPHLKDFSNAKVAKAIKKAIKNSPKKIKEEPNEFIFVTSAGTKVNDAHVNEYLNPYHITSKGIRGYFANRNIIKRLESVDIPESEKERKKILNRAIKESAKIVQHGASTLKTHYMIPELMDEYVLHGRIIDMKKLGYYENGGQAGEENTSNEPTEKDKEYLQIGEEIQEADKAPIFVPVTSYFFNKKEIPEAVNEAIEKLYAKASETEDGIYGMIKSLPIEQVDFKDIVPMQDDLNAQKLEEYIKLKDAKFPEGFAVKYLGKYYMNDGHHRAISQHMNYKPILAHTYNIKNKQAENMTKEKKDHIGDSTIPSEEIIHKFYLEADEKGAHKTAMEYMRNNIFTEDIMHSILEGYARGKTPQEQKDILVKLTSPSFKKDYGVESYENAGEIIIYQDPDKSKQIEVRIEGDTIWLTQKQMAELFHKESHTIGEHIKNIYQDAELQEVGTARKNRVVQKEGNRDVERDVLFYNLDMVLSVGYRVNSKRGTQFRIWATQRLKEYLIKGYAINEKRLLASAEHLKRVDYLIETIKESQKEGRLNADSDTVLNLISSYTKAFELFNDVDTDSLKRKNLNQNIIYEINYEDAIEVVNKLKREVVERGESTPTFGEEADDKFKSAIGAVSQTFGGKYLYPSIEEQASNLLYLVAEGHALKDGNKRCGSLLFIWFLEKNNYRFKNSGELKINDNALVLLALLMTSSKGEKKEFYIDLTINLLSNM